MYDPYYPQEPEPTMFPDQIGEWLLWGNDVPFVRVKVLAYNEANETALVEDERGVPHKVSASDLYDDPPHLVHVGDFGIDPPIPTRTYPRKKLTLRGRENPSDEPVLYDNAASVEQVKARLLRDWGKRRYARRDPVIVGVRTAPKKSWRSGKLISTRYMGVLIDDGQVWGAFGRTRGGNVQTAPFYDESAYEGLYVETPEETTAWETEKWRKAEEDYAAELRYREERKARQLAHAAKTGRPVLGRGR
jgi:hypothetical protein